MLSHKFDEALAFASALHRNQTRKVSDIPYVSHLLGVASLVLEMGGSEEQAIAALLHDGIEDQDLAPRTIERKFGAVVRQIVEDCSDCDGSENKPAWRDRKEAYISSLEMKGSDSLVVSLADKIHNAQTILDDLRIYGDSVFDRFKGKKEGTIWYYQSLAAQFQKLIPGPWADKFARIAKELEQ